MVTVRAAQARDAEAAVDVVRRSIIELCTADHSGDVDTLTKWLANKTPQHFLTWLANENNFCVIAVEHGEVLGVALVNRSGEISLFYLAPHVQRRGIGRVLHATLEEKARNWNLEKLHLNSTFVARHFYEALGYVPAGTAKSHFGVLHCYPYEKMLIPNSSSSGRDIGATGADRRRST
jgi:GNAT superfamily N-acetyltransferase